LAEVRLIGDDCLRVVSEEVTSVDDSILELYDTMSIAMYKYEGIGLAAPQIGINKRVITIDEEGKALMMVNPKITWRSTEKCLFDEACLSVPEEHGEISRPKEIKVKFQNIKGKYKHWRLEGLLARVVQHEIDHLDGILFVDYLEEKDEHSIKNAPD
tara:strand:- start:1620 stop:2090 length:471 start_codon:yes stop_codon:yes gene_type:complete